MMFPKKPKLYIVGLPISSDSVTPEFLEFIQQDVQTICIMSGSLNLNDIERSSEYKSSHIGFDLLIKNGFQFIDSDKPINQKKVVFMVKKCWNREDGTRISANGVGKRIIELAEELSKKYPNARISRIAPGSPYLYDGVSSFMIDNFSNIEVIDTKSSAELAYEKLSVELNINLPVDIVDPTKIVLQNNCINILGCVGFIYKDYVDLNQILKSIKTNSKIYDIKVGYNDSIKEIKKDDLRNFNENILGYSPSIIAIINESEEDIV